MKPIFGITGLLSGLFLGYYLRENTKIRPAIVNFIKSIKNTDNGEKKKYDNIPFQYKINKVVEKYSSNTSEYNRVVSAVDKRRNHVIEEEFEKIMREEQRSNPFKEILETSEFKSH